MNRFVAVFVGIAAAVSAWGCAQPGLEMRVDELCREREELTRQNLDLENRLAEAASREEGLQKEIEAAKARVPEIPADLQARGVKVKDRGDGQAIELPSEVFFASGSAKLTEAGEKALAEVAGALKKADDGAVIRVEGHTDSDPVHKAKVHCNWELSFQRAHAVLHYLVDKAGFDPHKLVCESFGEYRPQDPENKSRNRRVELVMSK